jgi:flavin reductase (DIM6/NTAB) family NADH-FMN oxidoreductase RutF
MEKTIIEIPQPLVGLSPVPVVLVTCFDLKTLRPNIITIGWVGVVCSKPPLISISVRPTRYSYKLIDDTGDFVINVPPESLMQAVDFCGMNSGKNVDKFKETKLKAASSIKTRSPLILECDLNLECIVKNKILLGSHCLFIGEVVKTHVNTNLLRNSKINFSKFKPIVANGLEYWNLSNKIGDIYQTETDCNKIIY